MTMTVQTWCRPSFDAVLVSVISMTLLFRYTESSDLKVSVRLGDDPSNQAGVVNVSIHGDTEWFPVQVNPYSRFRVGSVVCRQLSFGPPSFATPYYAYTSLEYNTDFIDVDCQGNEKSLSECEIKTDVSFESAMALRVDCLPAKANEFDAAVVKMHDFLAEGTVLVFVDGRWGPICGSPYGSSYNLCEAVCKQMGLMRCLNDYTSFLYLAEVQALPVLGKVDCKNGDILKTCDYVRLKNQTCPYFGKDYFKVSCTSDSLFNDHYATEFPVDDSNPEHPGFIFIIAFVMLSVFGVITVLYQRARSDMVTTTTTVVGEVPVDCPDSSQPTSLPPSYEMAVISEAYRLAPAPGYLPQESDRLLEHSSRYPSEPIPGYPRVPSTDQPNTALSNRPDPSVAFPPQVSMNQISQESSEDSELPTYEAATAQQQV